MQSIQPISDIIHTHCNFKQQRLNATHFPYLALYLAHSQYESGLQIAVDDTKRPALVNPIRLGSSL